MDSASTTRSCRRCSQKKIRCDKSQPCASCIKSASECIFPGPGRAQRRKKRPLKAQLVSRLKSLEKEVQVLTHKLEAVNQRSKQHPLTTDNRGAVEGEHGKLLVDRESIHYINHQVLVNLATQTNEDSEHFKHRLEKGEDESAVQEVASIGRECELATGNQFVFQYSSMAVSLSDFYPSSAHHRILWNLFEENVAPLAMIFHKPWLTSILNSAGATAIVDDKAFEAVRFAVYFAATTSMSPEQCTETSSQGSHPCSDTTDDAAFVRATTAAIHRIAQGLGLHRDGTYPGLSPFETELHSDLRCSSSNYDEGGSLNAVKRLHGLKEIHNRLQRQYLGLCDVSIPLQWVTATVIRLALARSWLIAHLPEGMSAAEQVSLMARSDVEDLKRGKLFVTAIEILEFAYLLETDPRTKKWSWLFQGYPQWHAAIFLLEQIGIGPQTMLTDRAWAVVVKVVTRWRNTDYQKDGVISILVSRLMAQAAVAQGCIWDGREREDGPGSPPENLSYSKNQ
ncbi:uncharacterized protein BO96DRAFT_482510 [Aspergillus niger CBS 101883]|uniref:Contig An12c0380, genomic contig n=3 Tax=Aspergillus niger TaxID=5061 RepID=A2R119_ASPNC|nr:uncharacterized protein BO96DRAFT_482510 [Aspergillus niger CBS 101883]XP_059601991.1 uncharacterized protein An12g10620 [Aspergillus niger]PYH53327.1 hypothetical protein BO96DRAFT_482510 [Aspergillus niger CBS 101883]RDH22029.1 hypothetical protein M747DRAFT_234289 [Aspergillus niger ATCC 13496]CAK41409.1 unnamed protein product [Aspergillus niger]